MKKILSVSGKPGLYKLLSQGKNMIVAESLLTGKKGPIYANEKVVSLNDIAMFTTEEDTPLTKVLENMYSYEQGKAASIATNVDNKALFAYFKNILPNFDQERVHPSDIKKLISWYNLLVDKGYTSFSEQEENNSAE